MTIKVTGCMNCPMLNEDSEYGDTCRHPESVTKFTGRMGTSIDNYDDLFDIITPDWCPLNKEPITIEKV